MAVPIRVVPAQAAGERQIPAAIWAARLTSITRAPPSNVKQAKARNDPPGPFTPAEVTTFMAAMKARYPQHYAMAYFGLATRRSQTLGDEVMNTTKQKRRCVFSSKLCRCGRYASMQRQTPEVIATLRWHVETQLVTPEQQDSDLLFPSVTGGYRSPSVLNKPFADIAEAIELGKAFTQRGLRRTFNDLARAARVEALVTRSISGHLTDRMHEYYSTVQADEQRDGIARVIDLFAHRVTDPVGREVGRIAGRWGGSRKNRPAGQR